MYIIRFIIYRFFNIDMNIIWYQYYILGALVLDVLDVTNMPKATRNQPWSSHPATRRLFYHLFLWAIYTIAILNNQKVIWVICLTKFGHWSQIADCLWASWWYWFALHWREQSGVLAGIEVAQSCWTPKKSWSKTILRTSQLYTAPHVRASINRFIVQVLCAAASVKMLGHWMPQPGDPKSGPYYIHHHRGL